MHFQEVQKWNISICEHDSVILYILVQRDTRDEPFKCLEEMSLKKVFEQHGIIFKSNISIK